MKQALPGATAPGSGDDRKPAADRPGTPGYDHDRRWNTWWGPVTDIAYREMQDTS